MTKIYFFIGVGLVTVWVLTWFGVKGMYKSLDRGEESRFVKMFIPKDLQKNLDDIERQAQIDQKRRERKLAEKEQAEDKE
ncbi:MAG: hypothetical protein E7218_01715 [Anaerofustis stercorihominis]|nr:hypothetical protein [Anaerofustis stercorihominis]